jgi:hypothetical protein
MVRPRGNRLLDRADERSDGQRTGLNPPLRKPHGENRLAVEEQLDDGHRVQSHTFGAELETVRP